MYRQILTNDFLLVCEKGFNNFGFVYDSDDQDERLHRLNFHLNRGDYFEAMASIFDIMRKEKNLNWKKVLERMAKDLRYLQENYRIEKK